jgi:glyoxylase I family protein
MLLIYALLLACLCLTALDGAVGFIGEVRVTTSSRLQSTESADVVYGGLHHAGLLVADTELAKKFLIGVFGFSDESELRPKTLPYPGAFLRCGAHQIHLMELPNPDADSTRPEYVGRDRHLALAVNSVESLRARLDKVGHAYKLSSSGRKALFCRDVDSNGFEFVEVEGL